MQHLVVKNKILIVVDEEDKLFQLNYVDIVLIELISESYQSIHYLLHPSNLQMIVRFVKLHLNLLSSNRIVFNVIL